MSAPVLHRQALVYRGIDVDIKDLTGARVEHYVHWRGHRWWTLDEKVARIWANSRGLVLVGEAQNVTAKGSLKVVDLMRGGTVFLKEVKQL